MHRKTTNKNQGAVVIDHRGKNGLPGDSGAPGKDGQNGQHARPITVSLKTDGHVVLVDSGDNTQSLPLHASNIAITLIATGGKGGNGGPGSNGPVGQNGMDATPDSDAANGHPGGDGGPGAAGGNGGSGGNGADITVRVTEENTDLLMLLDHKNNGGHGGKGGVGGEGGQGGHGGQGGKGRSWLEYGGTDPNGKDIRIFHFKPDGPPGPRGQDGSRGPLGIQGKDGIDGKYRICVGQTVYTERYDLKLVTNRIQIASEDGVIEPGETLSVGGLEYQNIGGMPTPTIDFYVVPNQWIEFNPRDTLRLRTPIGPGKSFTLKEAFKFKIKPLSGPAIGNAFYAEAQVHFGASVPRVNKAFPKASAAMPASFVLRYPIEMSHVAAPSTITQREEAPFATMLRNISTQPIGTQYKTGRSIKFKLEIQQGGMEDTLYVQGTEGNFGYTLSSA
jgi:hypothetical protein